MRLPLLDRLICGGGALPPRRDLVVWSRFRRKLNHPQAPTRHHLHGRSPPPVQPRAGLADHAPGFSVSTSRRIIADVRGVPDFLDRATPSNLPRSRPYRRRPVLWAHDDQRAGICKGQDLHGGQERAAKAEG